MRNFAFLQQKQPTLYDLCDKAEQYCYTDANACLFKLGLAGEGMPK